MTKLISVKRISENIFEIEYKNLFRTKKKLVFKEQILYNCWRELDTGDSLGVNRYDFRHSLNVLEKELKIGEIYIIVNK